MDTKGKISDAEFEDLVGEQKSVIFAQVSEKLAKKNEEAKELRALIESTEQLLEQQKSTLRAIEEEEMPSLMDELGVSKIVLKNGVQIVVDTSLHAAIPAMNKSEAHKWLRDNNFDIIKNELLIKFNKTEDNLVGELRGKAEDLGLVCEQKESVHNQTLKAFVREQMKLGVKLPSHLFDVFVKRIVNTK